MRYTLRKICKAYQRPDQIRRQCDKDEPYGPGYEETLEMAYENLQTEAQRGVAGIKEIPPPKKPERKKVSRKIMTKIDDKDVQANQVIFFRLSRKKWITKDGLELSDEFIQKHRHQLPFAKDGGLGFVIIK
jgi:hypothetical protein